MFSSLKAQTPSGSDYLVARPIPAKTLFYDYAGTGTLMPKIKWGLDEAWCSESNMKQGRNYLNLFNKNVDIVRLSFQPCFQLSASGLSADHINGTLNDNGTYKIVGLSERLRVLNLLWNENNANLTANKPEIFLNCDPADAMNSYYTYTNTNATYNNSTYVTRWVNLITYTGKYIENQGYTVTGVAPFNEPDLKSTGYPPVRPSNDDTYRARNSALQSSICSSLKSNSWWNSNRKTMGGNTLNPDYASTYYDSYKANFDEGNTHQLAGSASNYIAFMNKVSNTDGKPLCQDELHNVMEAMVGANYGMDDGIWWGTSEHARSQFCRANDGTGYRLAYHEDTGTFTASSIYRNTQDGVTEAYIGCSERQSLETSYGFVSRDRDVYYDGYGPTRAFYMHLPGGVSGDYQSAAQISAERVINIQSGEDVQPAPTVGYFQIMNASTGTVMQANPNGQWEGSVTVGTGTGAGGQVWKIDPVSESIGGDFSYYNIIEVANNSLTFYLNNNTGGSGEPNVFMEGNPQITYPIYNDANAQWYFVYAGDGCYYIHHRRSNLCLDLNGTTVVQRTRTNSATQKWKLINPYCTANLTAPATPSGLTATALPAAVQLSWNAVSDSDIQGYTIMRSVSGQNDWNTIARAVEGTTYFDNTAKPGTTYVYKIKAMDKCCNYSGYSSTVTSAVTDAQGLIARWEFDNDVSDSTLNQMGCAVSTNNFVTNRKSGSHALSLDGSSNYAILPYTIGNHAALTFCGWVYWNGGSNWQRIFDFGTGEDNYLFLCPSNNNNQMVFEIKANGTTQNMTATKLSTGAWKHVAVTMTSGSVKIYVDGSLLKTATNITLKPSDVAGICNYLGRSQFIADPTFNGSLDDVRIYNYVLSQSEIQAIINATTTTEGEVEEPLPWEENDTFYLYNVESGLFLNQGNDWGTQAVLAETGLEWKVSDGMSSGTYRLSRTGQTNCLYVTSANGIYVDGNGNNDFVFQYDSNTGFTTISIVPQNTTYGTSAYGTTYLGWNGDPSNGTWGGGGQTVFSPQLYPLLHASDHSKSGIHWKFMTTSEYNSYQSRVSAAKSARQALYLYEQSAVANNIECQERTLYENPSTTSSSLPTATAFKNAILAYAAENASEDNPVDLSFLMSTPTCSSSTFSGWTTTGGNWGNNTTYYRNGDATVDNRFYEVWSNGWDNLTLDDRTLSQTVSNLPAGKYQLAVDIISTWQPDDSQTVTGVNLYIGDQQMACSTRNGAPQCIVTPALTVADNGSAAMGLSISGTNANWVAFDNFRLFYLGNAVANDVDEDGDFDIDDVHAVVLHLVGQEPAEFDAQAADVTGDGHVTLADVTTLVNLLNQLNQLP